jgi:DNA-directed RNA polymerase specialized sigma24 family protein
LKRDRIRTGPTQDRQKSEEVVLLDLKSALLKLPELDAVILGLKYFEQLSIHAIALKMELSEHQIRSSISKSLELLKAILNR